MTLRLLLLTIASTLALVAYQNPLSDQTAPPSPQPSPPAPAPPTPPPTPPTPSSDKTAPTVASISPENAAIGVAANAKIRIEFSEPMNQAQTEAAFQSTDMPSVTFTWSPNGRRLEIDPVGDLEHTSAGRVYGFRLGNTATDLAGNASTQLTSSFRTLLQVTRTLTSDSLLDGYVDGDGFVEVISPKIFVGDTASNAQIKGFLSFSLSSLQTDGLTTPERIMSAKLRVFQPGSFFGSPYTGFLLAGKHLLAAHIKYGAALNSGDFNAAILHDLGEISSDITFGYKTRDDALESVRDDWAQRIAREDRSQFTLFFPVATDADGNVDSIELYPREGPSSSTSPELEVTFLVP